jgi:hypothetical protein
MLVSKAVAAFFLGLAMLASASVPVLDVAEASSGPSPLAATCTVPTGQGPGYNASIGIRQNGKTVCVTIGEKLLVLLSAPEPNAAPWSSVHPSKAGIVEIAPLTLMLSRGTTGTNFKAIRAGRIELSSQRSACSPPASGGASCDAIVLWRVTLVVRSRSRAPIVPSGTGVYGLVTAGPTCPVEQVGNPCPPRPVAAEVDVQDMDGRTIGTTRTDSAGRYSLSVKPGSYALVIVTGTTFPRCPSEPVSIPSGAPLRVDVNCDTGIR